MFIWGLFYGNLVFYFIIVTVVTVANLCKSLEKKFTDNTDFEIVPNNKESSNVLGLFWNPSSSDVFIFKATLALITPLTKRHILSQSAGIFDSLELISP